MNIKTVRISSAYGRIYESIRGDRPESFNEVNV